MTKSKKKKQNAGSAAKKPGKSTTTAGGSVKSISKKQKRRVSDEKLQELLGWQPHPNQLKILNSKKKEIVIAAGRGFGKTILCAYIALRELLQDDRQILLIAPTYNLNDRVLEYLEKWMQQYFPKILKGYRKNPPQSISTPWKSHVECRSAEAPTGILGKRFDLVVVDEAAKISKKVWETYIYPTTQMRGGRIVYISTPWGKNWFYEEWVRTKGFQFKSIDNPYYRQEDYDRAREVLAEGIFDQEYNATFISDATSVFKGVGRVVVKDILRDAIDGHSYIMGVDLGRHYDFTVLTVIDKHSNQVVYFDRFKTVDYTFQKKRIIAAAQRYNNARIIIDSSNVGDPIAEDIRRSSHLTVDGFKFAGGKSEIKKELIEKLSIYIQDKKIFIPKKRVLIDELEAFGVEMLDSGRYKYSAPQGKHDDCVISLALAVWGLQGEPDSRTPLQKEMEHDRIRRRRKQSFI